MIRYLPLAILVIAQLYALVEAVGTPKPRLMPRWAWVLVTLLVPAIGMVLWFGAGRPRSKNRGRYTGPDDDATFLGSL